MNIQRLLFRITLFAGCIFLVCPILEAQDNLLSNPGFEDPLDENSRWSAVSPPAVLERTQTNPLSGAWEGRVSGRTEQWHGARYGLSADALLTDGETYQFEMWARIDNPTPQTARLNLVIADDREVCPGALEPGIEWCYCFDMGAGDFACIYGLDAANSDSSTWTRLGWEGRVTFDGVPDFVQYYVDTQDGDPLSDIYLDDASVVDSQALFGDGFESGDTDSW